MRQLPFFAVTFSAAILLLSFGFLCGILSRGTRVPAPGRYMQMRLMDFDLTNPLLECEGTEATISDRVLRPFKEDLIILLDRIQQENGIRRVSVYFRDLNNGPWFGINENIAFHPGRLLNIPIAMAYFKEAEIHPDIFTRRVYFGQPRSVKVARNGRPSSVIKPGQSYSIGELLDTMLTESDDNAAQLLTKYINRRIYTGVFSDLGLQPFPNPSLSLRSHATFFRILFNASYLNKDASERLLAFLSRSVHRSGIASGIPPGIAVANDYDVQMDGIGGTSTAVSECGIVYYPNSPYLLCATSEGASKESNEAAQREISQFVFSEVDRHQRGSRRQ